MWTTNQAMNGALARNTCMAVPDNLCDVIGGLVSCFSRFLATFLTADHEPSCLLNALACSIGSALEARIPIDRGWEGGCAEGEGLSGRMKVSRVLKRPDAPSTLQGRGATTCHSVVMYEYTLIALQTLSMTSSAVWTLKHRAG